jgi:hypothetical protein
MAALKPLVLGPDGATISQLGAADTLTSASMADAPPPLNTWWNPMPGAISAQALVLNTLYLFPVRVPAMTLQSLGLEVSTLAAGSVLRAGIVTVGIVGGNIQLTGVLADLGTQDAATVGFKTFSTSLAWGGGDMWVAVAAQGAACTIRGLTNSHGVPMPLATTAETPGTNNARCTLSIAGVTGAIPASGALVSGSVTQPKLWLRRSAA